ncbi:unnamed protein product [Darwinula stevensoni]|uniref:Cell division protein FtsB n=1 Tax=Darwinula stevensoni TaxID=69355 RepID=A0A7R9AK45_9CRUS|nr:unnamed protein product [Darwinula stevensoni]CAG0909971.1 unnamed protein product [Darwinula stevensoni]
MAHRIIPVLLLGLLLVLHTQLWFGRGSVSTVAGMRQELATLEHANREAQLRNEQLSNEVRDLQDGLDMVEEHARQNLGMVKPREIFVQIAQRRP